MPISGGTLWAGDTYVVAAESDRDQIHILKRTPSLLQPLTTETRINLLPGEEPGRVIEADGRFFVVLRGAGSLAVLVPGGVEHAAAWRVAERIPVCASPRGVDAANGEIWVGCLDGTLVRLDATTGEEQARLRLPGDLRDIVITETSVFVSRFRSAEVLVLDHEGTLQRTVRLQASRFKGIDGRERIANAAYRMVKAGPDAVFVSHQLSSVDTGVSVVRPSPGGYGSRSCIGGLIVAGLTKVLSSGRFGMSEQGNLVMPLDLAYSSESSPSERLGRLAIAAFGARHEINRLGAFSGTNSVASLDPDPGRLVPPSNSNCKTTMVTQGTERTLAVAYAPDGALFRQSTHPHGVWSFEGRGVELAGPDNFDAGHDLFFGDAGAGISCGSCHLEGGEDGLTWIFQDLGARRTQDLRGGIMDTAPFHWQGDMRDLDHLIDEVMGTRMGGPLLSADYVMALRRYIESLRHPATPATDNYAALQRGRAIFESDETACASCHAGAALTSAGSHDVGTGFAAQVPSLRGLNLRAPFMHDGCAETVRDRFDPECGGDNHGRVDHLDARGMDDLVAYLESL